MRSKILFVSERVTLSQLVRLVSLARALDPRVYEVHLASAHFDDVAVGGADFVRHSIHSISPQRAASRLRGGRRIYGTAEIRRYVKDDLALLSRVVPDVVVGDLRLSLAISAPVARIPYVALANAYFSPFAIRDGFPLPDHPIVALLGEARAERHFPRAIPKVFSWFAKPVNDVRREYGLSPIGSLLDVLTHADRVMYADTPSLVPLAGAPPSHEFIGPVHWSPEVDLPAFWDELDDGRPAVYVTLGSSGDVRLLPMVVRTLAALPVTVLVATAGRAPLRDMGPNVRVTDYLPGERAARRSLFVVSNGGSSTGYQALSEGVPVLGIPSNLDQYLAMTAIERAGAGRLLRARSLTQADLWRAASSLLSSDTYRQAARRIQVDFARWSFADRFRNLLGRVARPLKTERVSPAAIAVALTLGSALTLTPGAVRARAPAALNEIHFSAVVDGNRGHLICALFRSSGWLREPVQWRRAPIRDGEAECVFTSVAPDVYGISAFHDENDNQRLDTNFLGIPTEHWCVSRGAKAYFSPPSFEDAKFRYLGGGMWHRADLR